MSIGSSYPSSLIVKENQTVSDRTRCFCLCQLFQTTQRQKLDDLAELSDLRRDPARGPEEGKLIVLSLGRDRGTVSGGAGELPAPWVGADGWGICPSEEREDMLVSG